jgi:membrane-associated phospholipid phosphatase
MAIEAHGSVRLDMLMKTTDPRSADAGAFPPLTLPGQAPSDHRTHRRSQPKGLPPFLALWLLSLVLCAAAVAIAFAYLDVPIARHFRDMIRTLRPLNAAFGAAVILSLEAAVTLALVITRMLRGRISRFGEAVAIACVASICTYGINSEVLKPLLGVPTPVAVVVAGSRHTWHLLRGSAMSSFPSGHMTLAGAFAGVFMRLFRISVWPFTALLLLAAALLVIGDWHFLSDVIAGTFVGVSAGMLAGQIWTVHSQLPRS